MKNVIKSFMPGVLFIAIVFSFALSAMLSSSASASAKAKLSCKRKTIYVSHNGAVFNLKSFTVKIKNVSSKVKWKTSDNDIVRIRSSKRKKNTSTVKCYAYGLGEATLTAKVGKKSYKCKIKVVSKESTWTILRNVILNSDSVNSSGNHFIAYTYKDAKGGVVYDATNRSFNFICTRTSSTVSSSISITVKESSLKQGDLYYVIVYKDGSYKSAELVASTSLKYIDDDYSINWDVKSSQGLSDAQAKNMADTFLGLSYQMWDCALLDNAGMKVHDLGFGVIN